MIEDMGDFGSMTPPPPPPGEQPAAPKSRSKARGVAAGVGVALVVAAGGGALAASTATGSTPSASPGGATPSEGAPLPGGEGPMTLHRFGGRGPGGFGGPGGPLGEGVVHGTFVVPKAGGGYETDQVQTGTVAAVSATSIQVTSKDGFKADYVVPKGAVVGAERDGIGSVKKGDEVTVTATVSGSTATVNQLMDVTQLKAHAGTWPGGPKGFRFAGPRGPMAGSSATPTAPPTNS